MISPLCVSVALLAALALEVEGCGKWKATSSSTQITNSGQQWRQNGRCNWCGVRADFPMCTGTYDTHEYTVRIDSGTYHQVGIAKSSWNQAGTGSSSMNNHYAFLYSHSSGWNRHKGACTKVSGSWSGTWDRQNKGKEIRVKLDCKKHTMTFTTERQSLAVMKYNTNWKTVYAAAAGQSSDNVYTLIERKNCKAPTWAAKDDLTKLEAKLTAVATKNTKDVAALKAAFDGFQKKASTDIANLRKEVNANTAKYTKGQVDSLIKNADVSSQIDTKVAAVQSKLDALARSVAAQISSAVTSAATDQTAETANSIDALKGGLKAAFKSAGQSVKGSVVAPESTWAEGDADSAVVTAKMANVAGVIKMSGKAITLNNKVVLPFDEQAGAIEDAVEKAISSIADGF